MIENGHRGLQAYRPICYILLRFLRFLRFFSKSRKRDFLRFLPCFICFLEQCLSRGALATFNTDDKNDDADIA